MEHQRAIERTSSRTLHTRTFVLRGCALAVLLLVLSSPTAAISSGVSDPDLTTHLNRERTSAARSPLTPHLLLTAAAQQRAEELAGNGFASHFRPDGRIFATAAVESGYAFAHLGENIAIGFHEEAAIVRAWLESPSHRRNVLQARYRDLGIGIAAGTIDGVPVTIVVQLVGQPAR